MKAPKIRFDAAKMQQLLLMHVEKIVLGVVILAVLWFVYQGATLTGLDPSKSPDQLAQKSVTVTTQINDPSHEQIIVPERDPKHPVTNLVKQGQVANLYSEYKLPNGWKTPDYPKAIQRVDPRNFAPSKPTVHAYYGPLAMVPGKTDEDPILAIQTETPGEEGAQPRQPAVRPQPGVRQPPRGEGPGGRPQAGPGPGPGRRQPGGAGMLDGGPGMQLPPGYGMPGMRGGMPGGAQGDRSLPPEAIVGFRLGATGMIAKEGKAVVVLASIPFEKQIEEYKKAFEDALDFDEIRDIPRYASFQIERADVTDNPEIDPAQATWTALQVVKAARETALWGPSPAEIVDLNALDPILTHRVPPFLQRELYDAMVHPDVPRSTLVAADGQNLDGQPNPAAAPGTEDDLLSGQPAGAAAGAGGEGGGGRMMQPGVRPGAARPGGYGPPGGYGGGFRGMPSRGGYGEGAMPGAPGSGQEMKVAKFKLLRFTDTTVEPLRKYRYRVKLMMEDPNNPYAGAKSLPWDPSRAAPLRKPSTQSMSGNVINRVQKADASGNQYPFLLESEPSEPSDIIELPPANKYFAGKATPGGGSALKAGTPIIYTSQPSATILTVEWDKKLAVDVPAEKDVFRGSTLNFDKEVDVIHPALLMIHPIGKYPFRNNSLVLDFVGGSDVPTQNSRSDTKVPEPCEMLIVDGLGNLQLLNETDDVDGFRRYLPPKKEEPKANTGPGGFGPEAPAPGGILDGPRGPARPKRGGGKEG